MKGKLDAAAPRRGSTPAPSQSIQAVSHIGRPGSNKRAVLVEFSTHAAKREAFKLSAQLRREGLHVADDLTHKAVEGPKGLGNGLLCPQAEGFQPLLSAWAAPAQGPGASTEYARGGRQFECLPLPVPPGHLLGPLALLLGLGPLLLLVEA